MAFVIGSLLLLAALPLLGRQISGQLHARVYDVALPAGILLGDIQLSRALSRSSLRDFLATGDERYRTAYAHSAQRARSAHERLPSLVGRTSDAVRARYASFAEASARWDSRAGELLAMGSVDPAAARNALVETNLYEEALVAGSALAGEMAGFAGRVGDRAATVEQGFAVASMLLAGLALVSALLVRRLGGRLRAVALEADARRAEIERLLASKAQLMRGITHDLKNPIGAADGYAQLLQDVAQPPLTTGQALYVERLREAIGSSLEIIQRILELAREDGQLRIVRAPIDPRRLVLAVVEQHRGLCAAADIELVADVADAPTSIWTDAARATEVIANLVSNACKYSGPGRTVRIRTRRCGEDWLAVDVSDDGPGIPPHLGQRVFDEFVRGEKPGAPGAGVGLAIARRLAHLLGGQLTLESEVGRGSTFTFRLPLLRSERTVRRQADGR